MQLRVVRDDVQASIETARKRRAWLGKAGLSHGVVFGAECELDGVSHSGGLKEWRQSALTMNNDD